MEKCLYDSKLYLDELTKVASDPIFKEFEGKNILLTGGTGLILSYFVDAILSSDIKCRLFLVVRDFKHAFVRFSKFVGDGRLQFIEKDLTEIGLFENLKLDYVISGASKTHPFAYANYPVETLLDNIVGTKNLLDVADYHKARFLLLSSCEIYGKNDQGSLKETDLSYISPLEPRSCYNLGKLTSENLAISYLSEYNTDVVIARLSRIFGPTIKFDDAKALSQFMFKALNNEDVVLKSKGDQKFNYQYVGDTVRSIAYILVKGETGKAYNSTNEELYELRQLAGKIASLNNKEVVYDLNDDFGGKGYSKSKNSMLTIDEIKKLGFKNEFEILDSLEVTFKILKEII